MLTREEIRKMTQEVTYKRGTQIYYSKNRIPEFHVTEQRTASKRSIRLRDMVEARVRISPTENCRVRLEYDRESDVLVSAACQCLAFANLNGICKHCVAVLMKYAEWQQKQKLYIQPAGNFERIEGTLQGAADAFGGSSEVSDSGSENQPESGTPAASEQPSAAVTAPLSLLQQEIRIEDAAPKEATTPIPQKRISKFCFS